MGDRKLGGMTLTSHKPDQATAAGQAGGWAKWAPLSVILCGTFVFILDR
jgi:hypothetical protein